MEPQVMDLDAQREVYYRFAVPLLTTNPCGTKTRSTEDQLETEKELIEVDFEHYVEREELATQCEGRFSSSYLLLFSPGSDGIDISDDTKMIHEQLHDNHYHHVRPLETQNHVKYLLKSFESLSASYTALDASQPWLCYWVSHALDLMGYLDHAEPYIPGMIQLLAKCQNETGGFGGGPGQVSHLAPTFSGICALSILASHQKRTSATNPSGQDIYSLVNRTKLYEWLLELKNPAAGSFQVSRDGEEDVRATYCALVVAKLTNILDARLCHGVKDFIRSLRSFDGGLGGEPGNEAHGGYAYCALAALRIVESFEKASGSSTSSQPAIPEAEFLNWLYFRQFSMEGGFSGRSNKLVDSCYSFWIGACFPMMHTVMNGSALTRYVLNYCQQENTGGLRDKPSRYPDYYHTCYALSGLSIAEHYGRNVGPKRIVDIRKTHPVINLCLERLDDAWDHFYPGEKVVLS